MNQGDAAELADETAWWKSAVIYEIALDLVS
jgi:hypothetical protein